MNLLQRVVNLFEDKRSTNSQQLFELIALGNATHAGPSVTEDNAMRSSAVYACIRIISESIASLPLVLYRQNGRNKERATNHPAYPLLHDMANPEMTAFEWRELMMAHALLTGNGFSEKDIDSQGRVRALWPLHPGKMERYEKRSDGLWWFYRTPDNDLRAIPQYRIHHIKGLGNGIMGYSPIMQAARQAIGLSLATEEYGARFFSNGAKSGIMLKVPNKLSPAAYERLKASFNDQYQGLSNAHRVKILEEGMDVATIGIPPNEAQFLETRKFQVTEIARIYRVPPHMLADLDRATFSNIEHQSLSFVMHTLMPWLVRHEQAIYRDLLTESDRRNHFAKYVVAGLVRGDIATRYQAYTTAVTTGFMTRNEVRELEDMNPLEGLDEPLLPLNMMEANAELPQPSAAQSGSQPQAQERAAIDDREMRARKVGADRRALIKRNARLFEDATGRLVKREVGAIRKAAKANLGKRNATDFARWLETFYEEMRNWLPEYYRAIMETYAETIMAAVASELDGEPAPLDDELRDWITGYLDNFTAVYTVGSHKQLNSLLAEAEDEEDAERLINERLDGWEANKATKTGLDQAVEAGNALAVYAYAAAGVAYLRWSASGESCPLCQKLDGRRIPIKGAFVEAGESVEADGVDPLPVVRTIRHSPLHSGCDCSVVAG